MMGDDIPITGEPKNEFDFNGDLNMNKHTPIEYLFIIQS